MTKCGFNLLLGAAIHDIRVVAHPPPPDAAPSLDLPVRMAVVGGPFTGKTTLSQALAEAQNATVIVPENLVQSALLAAAQYIEPQAQVRSLLAPIFPKHSIQGCHIPVKLLPVTTKSPTPSHVHSCQLSTMTRAYFCEIASYMTVIRREVGTTMYYRRSTVALTARRCVARRGGGRV